MPIWFLLVLLVLVVFAVVLAVGMNRRSAAGVSAPQTTIIKEEREPDEP